ncbi:heteromeric transposase endonuclease subunit TnsA [Ralstonia solanacearum]|nr:heteromeric transposase endonuclease subunit TnsA [Ralstonia solanacearum]
MPVRRIPKNYLFVTGRHASPRAAQVIEFESILENEYMLLLDSDPQVESYEGQPVEIPLSRGRIYVPDLLVTYRPASLGLQRPPELVEVKTQEHLNRYAEKYREKFAAAVVFAEERGWIFVTRTEADVRTPRIQNLKYLHRYRHTPADPAAAERLLDAMRLEGSPTTPAALLGNLAGSLEERANWTPVLWYLVALGAIQVDLQVPLTENTQLSLPG